MYTLVSRLLQLDGASAHGPDGSSDKLNIDFLDALPQLVQNQENVLIAGNFGQYFQLLELDVERIMIIDEEDLEFLREEKGPFLQDEVNGFEH